MYAWGNHHHTYVLIKSVVQESVHGLGTQPVGEAGTIMLSFALVGSLGNISIFLFKIRNLS